MPRISALAALAAPAAGDLFAIVDISAGPAATMRITYQDVLENMPDGLLATPALAFLTDQDLGLYRVAANTLGLAASAGVHVDSYIRHTGDTDTHILFTDDTIALVAGGTGFISAVEAATNRLELLNGLNFIGDTANTDMTVGLTINQGASANEIVAVKSSLVDQPDTDDAEADTFGTIGKAENTSGGMRIAGFKDPDGTAGRAVLLFAVLGENADTTKNVGSLGIIEMDARITDGGTGTGVVNAGGMLLSLRENGSTRFLFDEGGEMHSDAIIGVGDDWDEWDDLALASDLSRLPTAKFNEMMKYNAGDFERAGLLTLSTDENGVRHAFIKNKAMHQFAMCCFGEIYQRFKSQAAELATLKGQMRLLTEGA